MEDIDSSPLSPNPRKRSAPIEDRDTPGKKPLNLKGTQFVMPTPSDTEESSNASPTNDKPREGSPAPSISTMTSIEMVGSNQLNADGTADTRPDASTKPPPAKRRKLTTAEKEAEARAKAEKKQERDEQKARRDEEKRAKDEEKRRKAEEREAKKREKDLEEQRKEDVKLKKDRSQLRLAAFFGGKPSTPAKTRTADIGESSSGSARRKSLSLEPFDAVAAQIRRSASPTKGPPPSAAAASKDATPVPTPAKMKPTISDYDKYFLPFQLPNHSTLAASYDIPNPDDLAYWQGEFDREIRDPTFKEKVDLGLVEATAAIDHLFERNSKRGLPLLSMRAVMDRVQGTSQQPIDLTQESSSQQPVGLLQTMTRRHLQFHQDVRPAYFGTYTKALSPRSTRRLMIRPFAPVRKDTDYDYDSEAEWEEPEEGEDILGDEDDEAESLGDADEMDGFLDDEEDTSKRKMITGDLQPTCSGLCWENEFNVVVRSIEGDDGEIVTTEGTSSEMKGMRLGILLPHFAGGSIDPFSTVYWAHEMAPPGVPLQATAPSRTPLQERNSNGSPLSQTTLLGTNQSPANSATASTQGAKRGPKAQPRMLSKEDFAEFKQAVVGNTVPKAELQKALKLRFSKLTMEAIKDNLSTYFSYNGHKGSKKWYFVEATAAESPAA